ncbi:hypothetical protein CMI37_21775 [Candidatus Pacearchaeota archaeon]|nr:hypothetical protein [Candidatus Pacearchaeota archaeon]|tara:strand:+ start:1195 stop:1503 length:309 start_codon:yes stop_codon:yes gene_type:complete
MNQYLEERYGERQIYCGVHRQYDLDSCAACDSEQKGRGLWREARIWVRVTPDWLTNTGENAEAGGWASLKTDLETMIKRVGHDLGLEVDYEVWARDPEEEES